VERVNDILHGFLRRTPFRVLFRVAEAGNPVVEEFE